MKSWTIILSIFLLSLRTQACSFVKEMKQVYSLSGPITVGLKEIGLLKDTKLKGISVYHPVSTKEFSGEFLPGGIFLSRENAFGMIGSHVFYDDSRELTKMFSTLHLKVIVVKTRGLTPIDVTKDVAEVLRKHTTGCESRISAFQKKAERTANEVLKKVPPHFKAVFYMGRVRKDREPEMIVVNDGIIKWLREKKKLETYPSDLSYVAWSAKIMSSLSPETLKIGVIDSGASLQKQIDRVTPRAINLTYPGAMIPGLSQMEAWLYLCSNLK